MVLVSIISCNNKPQAVVQQQADVLQVDVLYTNSQGFKIKRIYTDNWGVLYVFAEDKDGKITAMSSR